MRLVFALCLLAGCGTLEPESPNGKLNSAPNATSNSSANNTTVNGATNGTTSNPDAWGTAGPADMAGKSPDGHAVCALSDVETSDLGGSSSSEVPPDPWSNAVVPDAAARCGDDDETLAWRLYNCERIGAGLAPLQCDQRLVWMGREHTLDMIRWDYFRHDNPAGEQPQDRADRHGVAWAGFAENIVTGQDVLQNHYSWMDSSGHRGNILGGYGYVGIGTELNPNSGLLLSTAVFLTTP